MLQQVALTAARRFGEFDSTRPFVAWALWLAKSRVADYYRKKDRERHVFSDAVLDQLGDFLSERHSETALRQLALEHCIEKLPEKSRRILDMRYVDDLPISEIAVGVKSTTGAVRAMLFRVRDALAACIECQLAKDTRS